MLLTVRLTALGQVTGVGVVILDSFTLNGQQDLFGLLVIAHANLGLGIVKAKVVVVEKVRLWRW